MAVCGKCHRDAPDGALFCSFCGESIKPVTTPGQEVDPLIGQTLGGKYFIHQLLGHGGMGDVYKATHLTLDRPVVLKLLKKLFHSDPSLVQRFHREARAASRLNHPNSITIIDFGQTDDGTLFMAMEYLAGKSLERVIAEEKALTEGRVIHVGAQILAALAEAHVMGIIHRDLKPANVMIEPRRDEPDFVKVLDFGIAKLNEPGGGGGPGLTQAGIVCGTPGYMSTEQVRGDELDARSDIYAVGVILYEMLTGLLPFESDTPMGLVTKHLVEDPPPVAMRRPGTLVSPELEAVIMRALARDRNDRFASADEMRAALLACATAGVPPALRPTPPPSSTMIFDPAVLPPMPTGRPVTDPGSARPVTGSGTARPVTGPGTARPVTGPGTARPSTGPGVASGRASDSAMEAQIGQAVQPTTADEQGGAERPGTPAPVRKTPMPRAGTPAPARKTPSPPRRVPHEMDAEVGAPAARGSKTPIIAGAAVGAVVVIGIVVWLATRGSSKTEEAPPPPVAAAPAKPAVPEPPAAQPAPPPPPAAQPAPAAQPPPVAAKPEPPPPAVQPKTASPAVQPKPPPAPEPKVAAAPRGSKGIRQVGEELNSIKTPPESSGEGVLAVVATPWAEVSIDGRVVGETPREVRLGAGTYRLKATHPALGKVEQTVTIKPGKRHIWSPTFAN